MNRERDSSWGGILFEKDGRTAGAIVLGFWFVFLIGIFIIASQDAGAATGLGLVSPPTISLTADSYGVALSPIPDVNNGLASASHTLTTSTNVPTGYSLKLVAANAPVLATTTGTITNPVALADNTWGYALTNAGAVGVVNDFDVSYATPIPSVASRWANPAESTVIKRRLTSATDDITDVYYGVKVDMNLASGTYVNSILYTATAHLADVPAPSIILITPANGTTIGGTAIQIVGTGFTVNDQSITTRVEIGGVDCANVVISSNVPVAGQDTIYCNTPGHSSVAAVDVDVTTWRSTVTSVNGFTYVAPTPTITAPVAGQIFDAGTNNINLMVTTDISGICYYGADENPTTIMATTGGMTHSTNIAGLVDESTNVLHVRCRAALGHSYGADVSAAFYVRAAMPAMPILSPADGEIVVSGATVITVASGGATCMWGVDSGAINDVSGTNRITVDGVNTLYYSCVAGAGNTASVARAGSWSYSGRAPVAQTGDAIQTVTTDTCPDVRTRVYDERDNATYWVQKLADGRCWMLTNLAYGGGGVDTYGDVKSITNNNSIDFARPYYMIPVGSNVTSGIVDPSASIDGTGQYGYLYNWCAAMGAQTGTGACSNSINPAPDASISICPYGWRLPTGGVGGEFVALNDAVNSGATNTDSGLRSDWLGMYSGFWNNGFGDRGRYGYYWSSTQDFNMTAYSMRLDSAGVRPLSYDIKRYGQAVRCVANYP